VLREPSPGEEWDEEELPVLRIEHHSGSEYLEVRTAAAAELTSRGALTLSEVVERLEAFGPEPRELFWVSSLRPLETGGDPGLAEYAVQLALPLRSLLTSNEPLSVALLASTHGLGTA
jgi:hypothetical protein